MSKVDDLIAAARGELGSSYLYGAEGPDRFDCSGLMQYVYAKIGVKLPRTAAEQQATATTVKSPVPGDLVFYGNPAHHVGLYIGGGKMIAAPHSGTVVQVQDVYGTPTYGRVSGLGATSAYVTDVVTGGISGALSDAINNVSQKAQETVIKVLIGGVGLALVGFGVVRMASPQLARAARNVREAIPV
jgi:hypothetical protein